MIVEYPQVGTDC